MPSLLTLTKVCANSDVSTMSTSKSESLGQDGVMLNRMLEEMKEVCGDDSDSDDDGQEEGSDGIEDSKFSDYKIRMKKRKALMKKVTNKYSLEKKKRKPTITVERKVTRVEDLPEVNTLPMDKRISMMNYLRDVIFTGLKYATKETIENGSIVNKMLKNLQLTSDCQRTRYRLHLELALKKKIGQFRNNSIKNLKWKYIQYQGKGEGKTTNET